VHKRCRHPIKDLDFHPEEGPRSQNNAFNKAIARHNQLRPDLGFSSWKVDFGLLRCNPTCIPLFQVMNHQAKISSCQRFGPPLSSDLGLHDILCQHHGTRTCPMILTASRASKRFLWNQTARVKHGCTRPNPSRSSSLQAWFAHGRSPAEPSGTRHSSQINGDTPSEDHHLDASWNPRTAAIILAETRSLHAADRLPTIGEIGLTLATQTSLGIRPHGAIRRQNLATRLQHRIGQRRHRLRSRRRLQRAAPYVHHLRASLPRRRALPWRRSNRRRATLETGTPRDGIRRGAPTPPAAFGSQVWPPPPVMATAAAGGGDQSRRALGIWGALRSRSRASDPGGAVPSRLASKAWPDIFCYLKVFHFLCLHFSKWDIPSLCINWCMRLSLLNFFMLTYKKETVRSYICAWSTNIYILEYGRYSRIVSTTKVLEALGAVNTCVWMGTRRSV
jgi:hypothetical protein